MRKRNIMVSVPYYNYTPFRIIVGFRQAPLHDQHATLAALSPADALEAVRVASPGWESLSICDQVPVGFWRGNALRTVATVVGNADPNIVRHCFWNDAHA